MKSLLLFPLALLVSTLTVHAADCFDGPFQAGMLQIGGGGGAPFCESRPDKLLFVKGIEVWAADDYIRGVKLTYSNDDKSHVIGTSEAVNEGQHQRLDWDPKEVHFDSLTLWGDGIGTRLGRIDIALSDGKSLKVGKVPEEGQQSFHMDIGSGTMMGVYGSAGADIDAMGFLFLKSPIEKISVGEVVFDEDVNAFASQRKGISTQVLDEGTQTNELDNTNVTFEFRRSLDKKKSEKLVSSTIHTIGAKIGVTIEASVPLLAKATGAVEASWSVQFQKLEETEKSNTITLSWGSVVMVMPHRTVHCKAWTEMGVFDSDYNSTVTIGLKDGSTYKFKDRGRYTSVSWARADSRCWYEDDTGNLIPPEVEAVPDAFPIEG